jgi:glycosyltransferase involved in cell wall biosynthesis
MDESLGSHVDVPAVVSSSDRQRGRRLCLLFVVENYPPHIGGVEIVFKNVCEGLAARGHDVTVLTRLLPATKRKEVRGGVRIIRIPSANNRYLFTLAAIPHAIRLAKHADVIHTTTFNGAPPAWLAARLRGKPVIITVHEIWIGKWRVYTNFSPLTAFLHDLLERMVFLPRFDRYACVSESTRRQFIAAKPALASRVVTIHNGFDPEHWSRARADAATLRSSHALDSAFVILGFGRPGTSKGFDYLIDAFPIVKRSVKNARLVLILSKDKQYAHEVERMKKRAHKDVLFLPSQPYDVLPSFAQMADCIVVPSLAEGFGYAVLEAVASGTPVVASDTTSIPEVIGGKHVLVRPANPAAIAKGILAVKANKYAVAPKRSFPWSEAVAAYEREYRGLL